MGNHVSDGGWNTKNTAEVALVGYSTEQQRGTNGAKKIMSIYIYRQQWRRWRRNRWGGLLVYLYLLDIVALQMPRWDF